ncbi:DUF4232 domain-containing protein [Kitasatospora sp. GP82]|uniref:DUF4232 domain-containing protein n=1 Tax=Kitasatospora sp. GP82 TaxID=3035089 RepID=UPI0024772C3D|nr:DUF4232 domain-containing protein [Kitasatospora sp. GP82]MDH6125813.1 hypothetical protein [Kitasatospora sp. GP82]
MSVKSVHRLSAIRRSVAVPAVVIAAVALTSTACSASPSPSAGSSGSSAVGGPGSSGGSASGGQSSSAGVTPVQAGNSTHACTSSQLSVVQKDPSVGAGQYYSTLVFTNTSATSCTLTGYPGVSYVAANGVQSGNPAVRAEGSVVTVTLKPGRTANAKLHDSNGIGGYDPKECRLTPAQGLRIYPPNEQAAIFLPWKTEHCAGPTVHALTIGPIEQG